MPDINLTSSKRIKSDQVNLNKLNKGRLNTNQAGFSQPSQTDTEASLKTDYDTDFPNAHPNGRIETVGDLVRHRFVLSVLVTERVSDLIQKMQKTGQGAAGVEDCRGRLIGLVRDTDLTRYLLRKRQFEEFEPHSDRLSENDLQVWDVMRPNPDCLHIRDDIEDALDIMTYCGFYQMPVISNPGKLAGIVDIAELQALVRKRSRALIEAKDSMLSSLMHHEAYGGGGGVVLDGLAAPERV